MGEVQLIPTNELLTELMSRHDTVIFMGVRLQTKEEITTYRRWKGNPYTCVGLCGSVVKNILKDYEQGETDISRCQEDT